MITLTQNEANKPDAVNLAMMLRFPIDRHWRGVTDPERSPTKKHHAKPYPKTMKTKPAMSALNAIITTVFLLSGCSSPQPASRPGSRTEASAQPKAEPQLRPTQERFTAEFVTSGEMPEPLPESGSFGIQHVFLGGAKSSTYFMAGNFILQTEPAARKPIRVTLRGVPDSLTWSIDDSSVASLSAADRQATLVFKKDGRAKIVVKSGDVVVFRLGLTAVTQTRENEAVWQLTIYRENEEGGRMDMYGDVPK